MFDRVELDAFEARHLSPAQWVSLRRGIISRAREERRQLLQQMIAGVLAAIRAARQAAGEFPGALRRGMRRYLARQQRRSELRQLHAMDDTALRDIGIARVEVQAALRSGDGVLRRGR